MPFDIGSEDPRGRLRGTAAGAAHIDDPNGGAARRQCMGDRAPDDAAAHNRNLHPAIVLTAAEFALPFACVGYLPTVSPQPGRRASIPVELVLYVSGTSSYAASATRNCEALLARFDRRAVRLEICDVSEHPDRAETDGICFTPVLLKRQPLPRTYILGDLSNTAALADLLVSCGVEPVDDHPEKDSHRRSRL